MMIRKAQLDVLTDAARKPFMEYMMGHLNRTYPEQTRMLREDGTRQRIRGGIARAAQYGIIGQRDVARYIDLMFMLSPTFDEDRRFPWASQILTDAGIDPVAKVDRLFEAANALI